MASHARLVGLQPAEADRQHATSSSCSSSGARGLEPGPQEGTPLVHDGVLFFPNPRDIIQALDATTGDLLWEHRRQPPTDLEKYVNAPFINRNLAIHGHLIIDTSADGFVYALDARSGKEVWNTQVIDYTTGIHQTTGPIVADGKVFTGRGCEPLPTTNSDACVIVAHDAATGKSSGARAPFPDPASGQRELGRRALRRAQARRRRGCRRATIPS